MARRKKREIPTPPAMLRLTGNKPHRIERGVVVQFRDSNGKLFNSRGIVMSATPSTNYTRAYGKEYYVCQVSSLPGTAMILRDAVKRSDKREIDSIITRSTMIHERSPTRMKPVGRVKKIPQVCTLAMKIEKGKL